MMVTDIDKLGNWEPVMTYSKSYMKGDAGLGMPFRHGNNQAANCAFADGHVATVREKEIPADITVADTGSFWGETDDKIVN